jgi:hypothetical protein
MNLKFIPLKNRDIVPISATVDMTGHIRFYSMIGPIPTIITGDDVYGGWEGSYWKTLIDWANEQEEVVALLQEHAQYIQERLGDGTDE